MWQIRFPINRSVIVWWTAVMLFWLPNLWIFSQKGQSLLFLTSGNSCSIWFENGPIAYCKPSLNLRQVRQKKQGQLQSSGRAEASRSTPAHRVGSSAHRQWLQYPTRPFPCTPLLASSSISELVCWPSYYSVNYSVALSNKLILV